MSYKETLRIALPSAISRVHGRSLDPVRVAGCTGHQKENPMKNPTYYTLEELTAATRGEWVTRSGALRFGPDAPIVAAHLVALSGLRRAGGLVIDAPTAAMASNVIRRMIDPAYDPDTFGSIPKASTIVATDIFHTFDVWNRGDAHTVTSDSMRPKMTQTLRRIVGRLPERGIRPSIAITVTDGMEGIANGVAVTAYRLA